jgi:hypothetical protein
MPSDQKAYSFTVVTISAEDFLHGLKPTIQIYTCKRTYNTFCLEKHLQYTRSVSFIFDVLRAPLCNSEAARLSYASDTSA